MTPTRQSFYLAILSVLVCKINAQSNSDFFGGTFGEFMSNTFIDSQFGDSFVSELMSAKYIFPGGRKSTTV